MDATLFSLEPFTVENPTHVHWYDCTCLECEHAHKYYCGNQDCEYCAAIGKYIQQNPWYTPEDFITYGSLIDHVGEDGSYTVNMLKKDYWHVSSASSPSYVSSSSGCHALSSDEIEREIERCIDMASYTNRYLLENNPVTVALQYMDEDHAQQYLAAQFECKSGRSRYTYIDQAHGVVYKFGSYGNSFNRAEFTNYMRFTEDKTDLSGKFKIPVAKCTLIDTADDQCVMVMEYVSGALCSEDDGFGSERDETPAWMPRGRYGRGSSIDCYQFGYDKDGQAVMYDHSFPY